MTIPISSVNQDDTLVWHHTKTGNFEIRSGYQIAIRDSQSRSSNGPSTSSQPPEKFWKTIWSLPVPPKVRHFWWRVCTNSLATKENLRRRNCAPSPSCPICGLCPESIEHLLFQCNWTRPVWFGCELGYLSGFNSSTSAIQWTQSVLESCPNDRDRKERLGKAATVGWCLWKARNEWVFNQSEVDPVQVIRQASFLWREGCSMAAMADSSPIPANSAVQICSRWTPLSQGLFKVNCDASFASQGTKTALAVILRNWRGQLIDGVVSTVHTSSVTQGEAHAVRLACMFLQALGLTNVQVESDSKSVIALCVSELVPPWECLAYLSDIRSMGHAASLSFSWVPRAANSVAHWLASSKLQNALPLDWIRNPPLSLRNLLVFDSLVA